MADFHQDIVACYLYSITKHGYPPEAGNTLNHLDELRELGYGSIELEGLRKSHLEGVYALREQIRTKAEKLHLNIPVFCIVLPGLCSADPAERAQNLSLFELGCETAQSLGAVAVLDNAPIPPWKFPEGIPVTRHYNEEVLAAATLPSDLNWDKYWDGLVETFRQACDIAAGKNLDYHLHPCHGALVNSTDAFLLFAEAVKRDNLLFNLDTANQFFLKDNLFLSLIRLKDHIKYIHLSDNRGMKVEHLSIGDGEIPWEPFFETLDRINYRGMFGIDVGGAESDITDLDAAYRHSAQQLTEFWFNQRS